MMEFRKVGRGGAGNFLPPPPKKSPKPPSEDIEAQKPRLSTSPPSLPPATPPPETKPQFQYSHSGRGGAGNYASTSELEKSRKASVDARPASKEVKAPEVGYYGRGGAGNCRKESGDAEAEEAKRKSETEERYKRFEEDIEMGVMKPEAVHLGAKEGGKEGE